MCLYMCVQGQQCDDKDEDGVKERASTIEIQDDKQTGATKSSHRKICKYTYAIFRGAQC